VEVRGIEPLASTLRT